MPRVPLISPDRSGEAQQTLQSIRDTFGTVPAMFQATANSPVALKHMWSGFTALAGGKLSPRLKELIAVAIADRNGCEYCLAAHTALGKKAGAGTQELIDAQAGHSDNPRFAAAIAFALKVVERRAQIRDDDLTRVRLAGFDDAAIVEILAHVALNLFTNYVNVALDVPVDFPAVTLRKTA